MKNLLILFIFFGLFFSTNNTSATIVYSNGTGGGNWASGGTWNPASVPACGDTIVILGTDVVTITAQQDYSACATPIFLVIHGTLSFPTNGPKLKLPCGSGVLITSNGLLTGGGSNGASNKMEICGAQVWKAGDGDQSDIGFGTAVGPVIVSLSIGLKSFTGLYLKGENVLKWSTGSEINNDYFVIERTNDGISFELVGMVDGHGSSSMQINYSLKDPNFKNNTVNYYRLKWVDFDGFAEYSYVISISNFGKEEPKLVGSFNMLGQPIGNNYKGIVIDMYSDGESIKRYQ